jgi:hypothetical protein
MVDQRDDGGLVRERYEPLEVLGRGRQGEVRKAVDHQHGRFVAPKVRPVPTAGQLDACVVHGDVKAANLILALDGRVVLVDFGISHRPGDPGVPSLGAPGYAARVRSCDTVVRQTIVEGMGCARRLRVHQQIAEALANVRTSDAHQPADGGLRPTTHTS